MICCKKFVENFLALLQSHKIAPTCVGCGSYFRNEAFFCTTCYGEIVDRYQKYETAYDITDNTEVTSFYRWVPNASDSLSRVIHLLKLAESKTAWNFLGEPFANKIYEGWNSRIDFKKTILVPVPSRNNTSLHTKNFSKVMSKKLGIKIKGLLQSPKGTTDSDHPAPQQKELSRRQRLSREFNFYVDFTQAGELDGVQNIVLIDDVVTTGATLQACKRQIQALKPSAKVSAWVMFKRI